MFLKTAKFEFNYFRKQPSFYVCLIVFFLLPFFAMVSDNVRIGAASNVNFNSPHAIIQTMLIMSLIGMFLVANFVGGAAVRDTAHKMDGMMLSLPITKTNYLWGKLLGAFAFCIVVFAAVPMGTFIGSFWPTVDAERLGATSLVPYFWGYLVFVIPNFLFCSVLFYVFAIKTRSMMGMYLGVVGFFIAYNVSNSLLDDPSMATAAALLDPFGLSAFAEATRYWTPFERNTNLIPLEGNLLTNRIIWLSVSVGLIVLTHLLVNIRKPKNLKAKKVKQDKKQAPLNAVLADSNRASINNKQKFITRTKFEIGQIVKSPPFVILMLISAFSLVSVFFSTDGVFGTSNWPLTKNMAYYIMGSFGLMIMIVVTYYSAETIWRERQLGIGDILEATPTRNWSIYFPKIIALSVVIAALTFSGVLFTASYQAAKSYTNFEWGLYVGIMSIEFIIPTIMMTLLAAFIQILSPNKYVGMLIFVVYFVGMLVARNFGLEHNMWHFANPPGLRYSDINGYGHFLEATTWYNLYWAGFSLILAIVGYALWPRGVEYGLKYRFSQTRQNMGGFGTASLAGAVTLFIGAGSYIYYNTRVLNEFVSRDDLIDLRVEFENKYKQFEKTPIPTITDVYSEVEFYPKERKVVATGHYLLENKNDFPLEKAMVTWEGGKHRELVYSVDGATEVERDDKFNVAWIKFEPALAPGKTSRMDFKFTRANKGFVDSGSDTRVVENGSFVNNGEIFPHFGYNRGYELSDRHERRKHDLEPRARAAKLEDESQYGTNFLGEEADFINFETIVSTTEGQFAISPGYIQKQWTENGRDYYHYKMDAPIFNFVAFLSGNYASVKEDYKGVSIEVYHQPEHDKNITRMVDSVKDSLDYFDKEFSPYQHRQVRIIEFPGYANFAQSFSNTVPYSENIGFIADLRDPNDVDYVYFVTAHEMAHQWWGHQVTPANVQGAAVLSETLAEYSAYMVMEKRLGKEHLRKFLKWELDRYLSRRSGETIEEMPLYRAENQQYIHYQKGGVVMYSLRDRFGEAVVNRALRKFLLAYQYKADPYPTTLDLLRYLKAEIPQSGHAFVDDMFTKITLFDLKTKTAEVKQLDNGQFELALTIEANKFYADGQGEEIDADINIDFDIGVFSQDPDDPEAKDHVIHFERHALVKGENKVVLTLDEKPTHAGVDPFITLIDRNSNDNLIKVSSE